MLNTKKTLYSLKDITVIPDYITHIKSRSEVNPYYGEDVNKHLPIFASPMGNVVNVQNAKYDFELFGIIPIIPRTVDYRMRLSCMAYRNQWIAMSLSEFEQFTLVHEFKDDVYPEHYLNKDYIEEDAPLCHMLNLNEYKILIDIANGHMSSTLYLIKEAKQLANRLNMKLTVMVGNVANPEILKFINSISINEQVVDYLRIGIGGGQCCITSAESAIHYPLASLIDDVYNMRDYLGSNSNVRNIKIVADGGIRTYADAIKCLALGADYVMIGTSFASLYESASPFYDEDRNQIEIKKNQLLQEKRRFIRENNLYKRNYGMSTPEAQKLINCNANMKLTEGLTRYMRCKQTLFDWTDEFTGYLKSCMSYTGSTTLQQFIGNVECYVMSPNAVNAFNKPQEV